MIEIAVLHNILKRTRNIIKILKTSTIEETVEFNKKYIALPAV